MDSEFKTCAVCALTCMKEHGADATKTASSLFTRPPCFLLTNLEISRDWTPIPRDFVEAHGETLRGTFRILGANGKEWSVEVGGKLLGFKGGWKNFVASTSVKRGDQMLFSLVSKNCFSVYLFNKLGVEVTPSPCITPNYAALAPNAECRRQKVKSEPKSDESDSKSSDNSECEASKCDAESPSDSDTKTISEFNGGKCGDGEICSTEKRGVKRKFTGSMKKENINPSSKKKVTTAYTKDGMLIEPGSMTTTYESLRRVVTQAERDRTMEAARSFKTKYPSIPVLMMPSHVYRGFWLTIPGKFSRKFLPKDKAEILLQDIHGFEWPATWIRNDHHTGVSGGWAAFSKDHCLEEGDVCVYEVTDSRDWRVLVHIFRVVNVDLIPGIRGGWEKTYNIVHGAMMNKSGKTRGRKKSRNTVKGMPVKRNDKASFSSESDAEDVALTKLYKEKHSDGSSDTTLEEIDVKPKILSKGPILKIAKVKLECGVPTTVKVKQEPGVMRKAKQDNRVYCGDVKPTLEDLTSLNLSALPRDPICELFQNMEETASVLSSASTVKPEPVETQALSKAVGRTWYPVVKMLGKRQNQKSPDLHDLLVALGGCVARTSESSCSCEDGNGNWWVPRSQFSSDLATCYFD